MPHSQRHRPVRAATGLDLDPSPCTTVRGAIEFITTTAARPVPATWQHYRVLLTYLDESYTQERYYIGGLIVPEASAIPLTAALDAVVGKVATQHAGVSRQAELHAYDLTGGKCDWTAVRDKLRVRIGVYREALQAIADHDARLVVRGVDVPRLHQRYGPQEHPHGVVLMHTIERVNDYAKTKGQLTLLIADEIDQMDEHRRGLWSHQRYGTWGWRARPIDHVVDTLHFAPSKATRLLQAADLAVFLYRRRRTVTETDARAERVWSDLENLLEPTIVHRHCWKP